MIWFTSDNHFGHSNIIKYTKRPFTNADEMDETMIERWNERIAPNDNVYHLGDVGLCTAPQLKEILDRLNGNIFLILGNHDGAALQCKKRFEWIKDYYELRVDDPDAQNGRQKIVLLHYAMRVWNGSHRGNFHLYGHSHGSLADDATMRSLDVGVDSHNFYPLSYEEVKGIMLKKQWIPLPKDRDI